MPTRFRGSLTGGSRRDGALLRQDRERVTVFDWVFSRVVWPCLVTSIFSLLGYYAVINLLKLQEILERMQP